MEKTSLSRAHFRRFSGLQAAIASYQDISFVQGVREKNNQVKSYLYGELEKLDLYYIPSHTNFVLFKVDQTASELTQKLELQKILVRPFEMHDKQWIRVSCGTKEELRAFIFGTASLPQGIPYQIKNFPS